MKFVRLPAAELVALLLTVLWLLGLRMALAAPWGFIPITIPGGLVDPGILYNPTDTWSYLSWAQQYYHGAPLAGLLYTTEPHASLLWLFPLWLIGKIAAWGALPLVGTYNLTGGAAALLAVYAFLRAAAALGLPPSSRHWAVVAFVTGSGGSWLWHLAHKLGWTGPANGGDLFFLDLFPATTLLVYAYHSVGLALLAVLWWTTAEWENRLISGQAAHCWPWTVGIVALLLGFARPYEPLAFLGAWMLKTAWHGWHRQHAPLVWKSSAKIAGILLLTLVPGIAWTAWVSIQPIWSTFANESLALGLNRGAWLCTLAGWIVLVALGIGPAWRTNERQAILALSACFLLASILLGLGYRQTKLASGLMLGPILMSGWGASRLVTSLGKLPLPARIVLGAATLTSLLGTASLFMVLQAIQLNGPCTIDADLVTLAKRLPFAPGSSPPVVLANAQTGGILPGLVGARVWAGHWSLTVQYHAKSVRLLAAGLDAQDLPADKDRANEILTGILAETRFDYALLDQRCTSALSELARRQWQPTAQTARWILLQAPPSA